MATLIVRRKGFREAGAGNLIFLFLLIPALLLLLGLASCSSGKEIQKEIHYSLSKIPGEWFLIDSDSNTVINGKQGLILAIPKNAFTDSMGNLVHGKIHMRISEANNMETIFASGLQTQSGNKLLSTNGMYKIEAWFNGGIAKVNPSSGVYAFFPTDKKDLKMGLYSGADSDNKLDWKLLNVKEVSIPNCGGSDPVAKKKCKRCEFLVNRMAKVKTGKRPKKTVDYSEDYWNERYYWDNGVMYFYSSGASTPVLTQKELDECKDWLENSEDGKVLLAKVNNIKVEQKKDIGDYYAFRLNQLGWYNIDRCVEKDLISFNGLVVDEKGVPVSGATVHLLCTDPSLKVHSITTANDGTFTLNFIAGPEFSLYAYDKDKVGQIKTSLYKTGNDISKIEISPISQNQIDEFLKALI